MSQKYFNEINILMSTLNNDIIHFKFSVFLFYVATHCLV